MGLLVGVEVVEAMEAVWVVVEVVDAMEAVWVGVVEVVAAMEAVAVPRAETMVALAVEWVWVWVEVGASGLLAAMWAWVGAEVGIWCGVVEVAVLEAVGERGIVEAEVGRAVPGCVG